MPFCLPCLLFPLPTVFYFYAFLFPYFCFHAIWSCASTSNSLYFLFTCKLSIICILPFRNPFSPSILHLCQHGVTGTLFAEWVRSSFLFLECLCSVKFFFRPLISVLFYGLCYLSTSSNACPSSTTFQNV